MVGQRFPSPRKRERTYIWRALGAAAGLTVKVGNAAVAHACSTSPWLRPGGKNDLALDTGTGAGVGMTSEQSTMFSIFCPSTWSLANAASNVEAMCAWLFTLACQRQDVNESRARFESDNRRNSPGIGLSVSPALPPEPGKRVPRSCVSTKNWVSKIEGVESNGRPCSVGSTSSAPAIEWLISEGRVSAEEICLENIAYDARRATSSAGLKPASAMRARSTGTFSGGIISER